MAHDIDDVADASPVVMESQNRRSWRHTNHPDRKAKKAPPAHKHANRGWEMLGIAFTGISSVVIVPLTAMLHLIAIILRGVARVLRGSPRLSATAILASILALVFVPHVGQSLARGFFAAGNGMMYISQIPRHVRDAYLAHQCEKPGAVCQLRLAASVTPENLTDCPASTRVRASRIDDIGMRRYLARSTSSTQIEFVCDFIAKTRVNVDPLDPIMIFVRESDGGLNAGNTQLVFSKEMDARQRTFLPIVAHFAKRDISTLRGNASGAMGVMQFKPEVWIAACMAGVCDGNHDGKMDPATWQDAFAAVISHIQHYRELGFSEDQIRKMYLTGNPNSEAQLRLVDVSG